MKRVTGIGGIFFKSKDPAKAREWYQKHLGINCPDEYVGVFEWRKSESPEEMGYSVWGPFPNDTDYFEPSQKDFMFNYRVENLDVLLKVLKEEGVEVIGDIQEFKYGRFGWILDPEGNKIELWEPNDQFLREVYQGKTML